MRFVSVIAALCLALAAAQAEAEPSRWSNPERVRGVAVVVSDGATDGCWPRPRATREAVELVFRSAGIEVGDGGDYGRQALSAANAVAAAARRGTAGSTAVADLYHGVEIVAFGRQADAGCLVHVSLRLLRPEVLADYPEARFLIYGSVTTILSGPKHRQQARITEFAREQATSLANAILASRQASGRSD